MKNQISHRLGLILLRILTFWPLLFAVYYGLQGKESAIFWVLGWLIYLLVANYPIGLLKLRLLGYSTPKQMYNPNHQNRPDFDGCRRPDAPLAGLEKLPQDSFSAKVGLPDVQVPASAFNQSTGLPMIGDLDSSGHYRNQ